MTNNSLSKSRVTWKYVRCGLCSWKAYCPIQKRNSRLRQHLYNKHRTEDELKKIRDELNEIKHTYKVMAQIRQMGDTVK